MFEVVTVGTGTTVVRADRRGASALVRAGDAALGVDLGLGALRGLLAEGVAHRDLRALLITHFHLDHLAELPFLLFAANYDETPRSLPLTLLGGPGFARHMEKLADLHGRWIEPRGYALDIRELGPGDRAEVAGTTLLAGPAAHRPESVSWRVEREGRAAVFTGDTGPAPELADFARAADLLVAEASLPPGGETPFHLTARQAGELAREAGAAHLALTHLYPAAEAADPLAEAARAYGGEITLAADGMRFPLGAP